MEMAYPHSMLTRFDIFSHRTHNIFTIILYIRSSALSEVKTGEASYFLPTGAGTLRIEKHPVGRNLSRMCVLRCLPGIWRPGAFDKITAFEGRAALREAGELMAMRSYVKLLRKMKLSAAKKKGRPYTIIAGCAGFAVALAKMLSQNSQVLIIAGKKDFRAVSLPPDGHIITGDVTDPDAFTEADVESADTVVAATGDDNVNLLVAQLARDVFGVKRVMALLNDPERECVYRELGVPAFSPALISAREIAREFSGEKVDAL